MWLCSAWLLEVCGAVTVLALLLGFLYTYFRQKGIKSVLAVSGGSETQTDKWSAGDIPSEPQDCSRASARSDPVKFCSHIQGEIKKTKHRIAQQKIEASMTAEERNKERDIQRRQLEEIFRAMEEQKEKFGVNDVSDIQEQLKMYIQ